MPNMTSRHLNLIVAVLPIAFWGAEIHAQDCGYGLSRDGLFARKAETSFAVVIARPPGYVSPGYDNLQGASVEDVGDDLGSAAGATVVYLRRFIPRSLTPPAEWRASDPFVAFQQFCEAAGLTVTTPQPGFWLVGDREAFEEGDLSIVVHPADPAQPGGQESLESRKIEDVLLRHLPIRTPAGKEGMIELAYYWVPNEPDTLLVVASWVPADGRLFAGAQAFKLRVGHDGPALSFSCLWHVTSLPGRLYPEIAEDFDGDGLRDFAISSNLSNSAEDIVLSGRDGSKLFEFLSNELAVEKTPGAKRIAVDSSREARKERDDIDEGPLLISYAAPDKRFAVRTDGLKAMRTLAARPNFAATDYPRRLLTEAVGSPDRVRVYVIAPAAHRPGSPVEEVSVDHPQWSLKPLSGENFRPPNYRSRLVFRFEGNKVLKERQRRAAPRSDP
jgi:hypothetical protein